VHQPGDPDPSAVWVGLGESTFAQERGRTFGREESLQIQREPEPNQEPKTEPVAKRVTERYPETCARRGEEESHGSNYRERKS